MVDDEYDGVDMELERITKEFEDRISKLNVPLSPDNIKVRDRTDEHICNKFHSEGGK